MQAAKAQNNLPAPPREFDESAATIDPAVLEERRFLQSAVQAVIRLEASGDRTMDAIENSQITLTFDRMPDSSRLIVLCINEPKALNAFVQSLARELQLSGKVSEAACTGTGHDDDPLVMRFRLHYESGDTSLFFEQAPSLPFIVEEPGEDNREVDSAILDDAPQPVVLNRRRTQASHAIVQLSHGWTPVKLPDSVHSDSVFGTFDSTVTFADGTLMIDRKLVLKRDRVEVAELPAFQKWTEGIAGGEGIALRSTLYYPERDASAGTEEQKKAAALIDEAFRDMQAHELDKAQVALDHAEEADPGHEILHEDRGELAAARGDYVTALAEYRKELEAFPNALFEMWSIAGAQLKLGDVNGAIATLQRWMVADPNSPFAATELMLQYNKMDRDDLAVRVGDDAMNIMTNDAKRHVDFLLIYGREQMLTGQARDAENTLEALLDLTVDDKIVNDAAYFLSEQGLSLDRAERSVREALTQFDTDNSESALSTSYADDSTKRTSLVLATWDTLGWILYRKGAVHEAEQYVRAAWRSRQDIAICRHLGDILRAEEKPVDAMDVYTLGLAMITGENAARMEKNPDAIAVREAVEQLKRKGNATTVKDPKAALLALRTLDLGPAAKPQARTPCNVILGPSALVVTSERYGSEAPIVVSDGKLLAGFFPPDSKAELNLRGTIQCDKSCSLVIAP